ncbi:ABC transporter A family member 7 isoform X3 [Vigna angularis]|uniref:ABC transporter A family member 7 isoform X3 n=1 Tax=Phaseolus angularis TaxID=3914 RepID=UPI0022B4646F|nr:ABC transporter A family member 7 isoform X3 [Vigna angularis]
MANSASASFFTQAKALLLKNITFQKRNVKTNVRLILFPAVLCVLLFVLQLLFDTQLDKSKFKCGCVCADNRTQISQCPNSEKRCGVQYSDFFQAAMCPIPNPVEWPPLLQLPAPPNRAVRTGFLPFFDLPDASCRRTDSCPLSLLFTGENHSFALSVSEKMFRSTLSISDFGSNFLAGLAVNVLGSESKPERNNFIEPAFSSNLPIYYLQTNCTGTENSGFSFPSPTGENNEIKCALAKNLWRNSSTDINSELYKGYQRGNSEGQINEIVSAFDFLNSNGNRYNVGIWYNSTYHQDTEYTANALLRVPRSVNLVILTSLVYEKQQKLRIMMKMHGLGDRPYWMISYGYFLVTSVIYMLCFVIFGSLLGKNITIEFISLRIYPFSLMLLTLFSGLKIFTANDYSIQFVFYFIYINLQIALAFLVATMFSNVKTATVTAYIGVFGTGLLGGFLFKFFVQNISFPRGWIILMELYPGFALYRGLYELAQFSIQGNTRGTDGMKWHNLSESTNGMKAVLIIMFAEWIVMLFAAFYIDQVLTLGSRKGPLFLLKGFQKKSPFQKLDTQMQVSKELSQMEKPDVIQEKEKVEELLLEPTINHAILCDDLRKVYPGRDGNPDKFAVRGLFLSVPPGECFGMLGPNGAGKTSFINMMIGLTKPTSGTAFVQGLDIRTQMGGIYTTMGVCPQHDLLWDNLTGREHLLFYGRLKNLRGSVLTQAVEDSLKDLNLFHGGVADKQVGKYSGGMKRRLSVAISLIGDPKIVYMDEPSSGLDPASRKRLWSVVKHAKQNRAIILTTHSMEEAEALCDRLGIFVNGSLQCVGNAKELKARYGGTYVLTVTTSSEHEKDVENMVQKLTPNANKIYHLSGTQKFELPKEDVRISDVFQAVDVAKRKFTVSAWGLVDTTLEDVFIKVAREAQAFDTLS